MSNSVDAAYRIVSIALADAYLLMIKTQSVHWNVTGANFYEIHNLTEAQYNELFLAIDELAEQIRIFGKTPPSTLGHFVSLSNLTEDVQSDVPSMIGALESGNSICAAFIRENLDEISDAGTVDLLTQRMRAYEKAAWMWRSMMPASAPITATMASAVSAQGPKREGKEKKKKDKEKKKKPASSSPKK